MTDDISSLERLKAALADRYELVRELGEGGMATVYLAEDLKHHRKVALKVLKPELAAVVGAERFLAEIEVTANLQHPSILPLFDSGEADSFLYYVMPFVQGESLRERLDRERQLPVDEAVRIGIELAEALDYAHRQGVIHRDIKPANVLLQEGRPLIADFGIALAVGAAGGARLTETGLSVGTPFYMSPEQATGDQVIGPQSDTYSLGCMLFEMLTGEPPYPGATAQAVLGKIIAGKPVSATEVRTSVPIHIDAAIRCTLEKLPADRFASAGDLAKALADPGFRHGEAVAAGIGGPRRSWNALTIGLTVVAAVSTGGLIFAATRSDPPMPVIRYALTFPEGQVPVAGQGAFGVSFGVSADGSRLAYVGPAGEGDSQLWVRERDALEGVPVPGTDLGVQPFFSPDGQRMGFIVTGSRELKVVSLGGEPPLTLVDSLVYRLGGSWGRDGYLYYCSLPDGGLYRVPATGGDIEQLSTADTTQGETRHAWPDALPSGRGVLITVQRGDNAYTPEDDVGVLDLESGRVEILFRGLLARYLPTGHILVVTHDGDLVAAPFDQERLEVTGPTVPLLSGLPGGVRGPDVAISRSGRLLYQPSGVTADRELIWVDRAGRATAVEPGWRLTPVDNGGLALSPDQTSIAVDVRPADGGSELWIKQIGGPFTRLGSGWRPSWSVDGRSVLYLSGVQGPSFDIWTRRADGSGDQELVLDLDDPLAEARRSIAGDWLVVRKLNPIFDVFAMRPGVDTVPVPLIATDFAESAISLSPNDRFLAYVSNSSGRPEVYVRPFPNVDDARIQVSTDGGVEPVWAHSGRELFYKNQSRELIAVSVNTNDAFQVLGREPLFTLPLGASVFSAYAQYDVTRDDQRFLMFRSTGGVGEGEVDRYIVVENFQEELLARVQN